MSNVKYYRYEINGGQEIIYTSIYLEEIKMIKETKFCRWVKPFKGGKKRLVHKKKIWDLSGYCAETKEFALKQFIWRTQKRLYWYNYWTNLCKNALQIAINLK